eukprot:CAMPEP_0172533732 /NCGR_PEP_ID=MMETSP1067-20121228/6331_1 /TAXON_ID=265564 ORGANISM="Thalassiosira punctigera, Strain Tpunct2005C2" /NCGR_SAMPLE_ID=MMETSP1067 /ASSEMBLY_ACC=CAM_ASM_000444 /LENGTH=134 /DNA_ID=CAMNT_0013318407 /DNA_START=203 /DNA_END=604 /DNA_ORIENTATION=+
MGTHVSERVKKHRAEKKRTVEGLAEIRAHNRVYAKRSRAKREIKRLTDEKSSMKDVLDLHEQSDLDNRTEQYKAQLLDGKKRKYEELSEDEQREVDVKVLRHEILAMKRIAKNDLMESAGMLLHLRGSETQLRW